MEEHPIIMQSESVKAILEGRKTQTRRVVIDPRTRQRQHRAVSSLSVTGGIFSMGDRQRELELTKDTPPNFPCPYGQVGDLLWVRETWALAIPAGASIFADRIPVFKADGEVVPRWRPSIFMPRWASRITLEITEIRVERVQEITAEDCRREGIDGRNMLDPYIKNDFHILWDSINAKRGYSWDTNPWVWVIGFKVN